MDLYTDETTVEFIFDLALTTLDDVDAWLVRDRGPVTYWVKPYPALGTGKDGRPSICVALHAWRSEELETPTPMDAIREQHAWSADRSLGDPNSRLPRLIRARYVPCWSTKGIVAMGTVPFGETFLKGDPIYGFIHIQKFGERRFGNGAE